MTSNRPNHECLPKPSPLLRHTTFFFYPYHSLPCTLTSQRNNTKQSPAWCLCPPRVYSGNGGACWDQSGEQRPHLLQDEATDRRKGATSAPQTHSLVFRRAAVCTAQTELLYVFRGESWGETTVQLLMIPSGVGGCFPACGACSLCRTRGQDRDQSTQLLFSSTGIISHANGIQRYKS